MAFDKNKFLARFIQEAREHCTLINSGLLGLEKNPGGLDTINAIYRSAHTIKGSSRMLKLFPVTEVAHKMEDVLDALKNQKIISSRELLDTLFRALDVISGLLDQVAAGNDLTEVPVDICRDLEKAAAQESSPGGNNDSVTTCSSGTPVPDEALPRKDSFEKSSDSEIIRIQAGKLDDLIKMMGEIVSSRNRFRQNLVDLKEAALLSELNLSALSTMTTAMANDAGHKQQALRTAQSLQAVLTRLTSSMKDNLLDQEQLTEQLQEVSLTMRMLPLSTIFESFHRTVREMAQAFGKDIDFVVDGGETELDKKIIEKIGDPLLHMIRNAVDHGIETREERLLAGKQERGSINVSAWYEGGSVIISLRDDGRGISLQKIKEKARQKKLFPDEILDSMSETEIIDIIFQPGFSTSPIITDLSGRGVGMDVVKKNIVENLQGTVRIDTKEGEGSSFYLKLPLNLALFRLMLVSAAGHVFALPAGPVCEIVTVPTSDLITILSKKAIRLRNEVIPVEDLGAILNLPVQGGKDSREALILVVNTGKESLGLTVDSVIDEETMIVKSLPSHMKNIQLVSGVTIGGKQQIVNVLNIPMLCKKAKEIKSSCHVEIREGKKKEITVLVVDDSINTREIEKSILEAYGYQVVLAGDGMEALEKSRGKQFDAIITDVEMPRLDGFTLTEQLRRDDRYKDTPIIIVTSREKEEDKKRGIMVGANAYIVKGAFDQTNLIETIQNLIG